jgi:hypothetical protein
MVTHSSGGEKPTPVPGIVTRLWPAEGSRHYAYQALIGGLLRHGWTVERVQQFVQALCVATHDNEVTSRNAIIGSTVERLKQNEPCYGWPKLSELIGAEQALSLRLAIDAALTVETLAQAKQLPSDFLRNLGVTDTADHAGYVTIDYRDAGGRTQAVRRRHSIASKPRWEKKTPARWLMAKITSQKP